jgi:hypothetical protein
MGFES